MTYIIDIIYTIDINIDIYRNVSMKPLQGFFYCWSPALCCCCKYPVFSHSLDRMVSWNVVWPGPIVLALYLIVSFCQPTGSHLASIRAGHIAIADLLIKEVSVISSPDMSHVLAVPDDGLQ